MTKQIVVNKSSFEQMEKGILKQVTNVSKSIIESFKFNMLLNMELTNKQKNKAQSGLKVFRSKNWDSKLSKEDAYKNYINNY
jgi:hypothetical protein